MDTIKTIFYSYNSKLLFLIFFSLFNISYFLTEKYHYHISTKLNNGNFMIFSCDGIYMITPNFNSFQLNTDIISGDNYNENIAHFLDKDGGYILYVTSSRQYLFSQDGYFINYYSYSLPTGFSRYSVIPKYLSNNYLYYYLIYYYNSTTINFKRIEYNLENDYFYTGGSYHYYYNHNLEDIDSNALITCEVMKHGKDDFIACFLASSLSNNNNKYINCIVFDFNLNVNKTSKTIYSGIKQFSKIKSSLMTIEGRKKVLIASHILDSQNKNNIFYSGYDISTNSFKEGIIPYKADCTINTGYINNNFFKETEKFIVSFLGYCQSMDEYNFFVYEFDKNFNCSFFGTIRNFILAPNDQTSTSSCTCAALTIYSNSLHTILFSSYTQKYCFIGNVYSNKLTSFILNRDINIINPIEKNSKEEPLEYICENFTDFNPISSNYIFLNNSIMNYLPKCTLETSILNQCCNNNYIKNTKTFIFNFNCSENFPYELINENKCIEYCDNISLSNGTCKFYNYANPEIDIQITTIPIISTLIEDNQITSIPIISTLIEDKQITSIPIFSTLIEDTQITSNPIFSTLIENNNNKFDSTYAITPEYTNTFLSPNISDIVSKKIESILNLNNDYENIIEDLKDLFSSGQINEQLDNILNGEKDIVVKNKDILVQITSTDNQKNNKNHNISSINLGECETILKTEDNINPNTSLLILKIDSFIEGSKIPVIQYEVYHPKNKSKLDLSLCDNSKIEINVPVSIDENKLFKYEPKSDYYNDRCFTFTSENGIDIPLLNRRKEFKNNNMSLCEGHCEYLGYNDETKNSICECGVKKEISILNIKLDYEGLYKKFDGLTSSNIDIIKCYHLIFRKKNLLYNIGFYILLIIILFFIISIFIFIFKGYKLLKKKINFVISITINKNKNNKKIGDNNNLPTTIRIIKKLAIIIIYQQLF